MTPGQITAEQFAKYPPQARQVATAHISLLRELPLAFLPLLLREMIAYDWKFPAERREIDDQMQYLGGMSAPQLATAMSAFGRLHLTPDLEAVDWVGEPARFAERLSAYLWSTHQMDPFREASIAYIQALHAAVPAVPVAVPRLTVVCFGAGVTSNKYPLFRKLKPHGVYFSNVQDEDGLEAVLAAAVSRAGQHPVPFGHWYIAGGESAKGGNGLTVVSYSALGAIRDKLVEKMRRVMQPGGGGPEVLRSMLAEMTPQELGLEGAGEAAVLNRFQVSMLAEGSGTQLFSTTFVQWTTREALRRAQPLTLVARYLPRQKEESMKELLAGSSHAPVPDLAGSLIDADMGAYYSWINQQRLPGADRAGFVAWCEGQREAFASGPAFARGTVQTSTTSLRAILQQAG